MKAPVAMLGIRFVTFPNTRWKAIEAAKDTRVLPVLAEYRFC